MAQHKAIEIPGLKLGTRGLEVLKLGFGCMGLTGIYNDPIPEDVGISIITHAFGRGITFFDTSDIYGPKTNEILVGKALKKLPREKAQLATKFGIVKIEQDNVEVKGTPEYVGSCCEASLKVLGVDYIDLYYVHRIDTTVPIEDTMAELKKLVKEGKVKYVGLSEASTDTIRRAHAVHPISALQMEWSLWTREIEGEIVSLCRFRGENLEENKRMFEKLEKLAEEHDCRPIQFALAWILHHGDDVVPIPGTTEIKNLDTNIESLLGVKLREKDLKVDLAQTADRGVCWPKDRRDVPGMFLEVREHSTTQGPEPVVLMSSTQETETSGPLKRWKLSMKK